GGGNIGVAKARCGCDAGSSAVFAPLWLLAVLLGRRRGRPLSLRERVRVRRSFVVALVALGLLSGCSISVPSGAKFSCSTDSDCDGDGYACVKGICCNSATESC